MTQEQFTYAVVLWMTPAGQLNFPARFRVLPAVGDVIDTKFGGDDYTLRVLERRFNSPESDSDHSIVLKCKPV